ncbi:MAG: hypothetical protein IT422_02490 [Pirellulaceae bacterium]|jgi:hypothetical protein|nr:hypothetical protein [Pirellulaceae bacterium]
MPMLFSNLNFFPWSSATFGSIPRAFWVGGMVIGWSCLGCNPTGPARQSVSGTVMLDGQPASGLSLVFTPTGSKQLGVASEVTDGRFSLDTTTGPSEGEYDVTVDTIEPDLEEFEQLRQAGKKPLSSIKLHPRYRKPGALQASVLADQENVFNFELKSR